MKLGTIIKQGAIIMTVLLLAACNKHHGMNGGADNDGMLSNGLGAGLNFGNSSEAGESYTTKAPHNQIYLFAYDSDSLKEKYAPSLQAQALYLTSHPSARVLVAGNTDERGSREYNIALGERRAMTVAEVMKMAGVSGRQIRVVSYGKERPAALGNDEASRAQNRRVEFTFEAK